MPTVRIGKRMKPERLHELIQKHFCTDCINRLFCLVAGTKAKYRPMFSRRNRKRKKIYVNCSNYKQINGNPNNLTVLVVRSDQIADHATVENFFDETLD